MTCAVNQIWCRYRIWCRIRILIHCYYACIPWTLIQDNKSCTDQLFHRPTAQRWPYHDVSSLMFSIVASHATLLSMPKLLNSEQDMLYCSLFLRFSTVGQPCYIALYTNASQQWASHEILLSIPTLFNSVQAMLNCSLSLRISTVGKSCYVPAYTQASQRRLYHQLLTRPSSQR